MISVHLFGRAAGLGALAVAARDAGAVLIEDAAQAIGASSDGHPVGSIGAVGCFSFYPTKNIGGAGDGGAVSTDDDECAQHMRRLRTHGAEPGDSLHTDCGFNARIGELQAAYVNAKLPHLREWTETRVEAAARYRERLAPLAAASRLHLPCAAPGGEHVWHQFVVRIAHERELVRTRLSAAGIETRVFYPVPVHLQPCFADLGLPSRLFAGNRTSRRGSALAAAVRVDHAEGSRRSVRAAGGSTHSMSGTRRAAKVVLVVGGLDPTAGAGVAADVRTLESFRVASAVAVTALAVQNGREVLRVVPVSSSLLRDQIEVVVASFRVAVVKCGMLATAGAVDVVAELLAGRFPIVLDPVLRSSGGQSLASRSMVSALRTKLLPKAAVLTPNLAEASLLAGITISDVESMKEAARRLLDQGPGAVVVKGGHLSGPPVDVLAVGRRVEVLRGSRLTTGDMHGTGCAFASALSAGLARGLSVRASVGAARRHVRSLIKQARRLPNGAIIRQA